MVLTMLFVVNPFGCVPIFVSLVKDFEPKRQRLILFRESVFGGILALVLLWAGRGFLQAIHIEDYAVNLSGGILIFLVAISMIFPESHKPVKEKNKDRQKKEPFVVPIATPLLAGGGFFAVLMNLVNAAPTFDVALALLITWLIVIPVSVSAAYLQKLLGKRGLLVLEQLMGMMLTMLAIQIILGGVNGFLDQDYLTFANLLIGG
jgi:multiple antibiotic resistance protein